MSTVAPAVEPVAPARTSGLAAIFEHTRYVLGENRVTAFAFGLLIVIVFAALFGPYVPNRELLAKADQVELQFWQQWGGPPNSTALEANAAAFSRPSAGPRGAGAFPQVKKLSLVELGTHVEVAFVVKYCHCGERAMVAALLRHLTPAPAQEAR